MAISVVIPLGTSSIWGEDEELKHCLRSVEKHLIGVGEVFIVGVLPKWATNVIHIAAKDEVGVQNRSKNIFNKIMLAVADNRVTDDFLFMNDDHFLKHDFVANEFPYHYREHDMIETVNRIKKLEWWKSLVTNTRDYLIANGKPVKMFDTHCPIVFNRNKFRELENVDWSKPNGYGIKSLYANIHLIQGTYYPDRKLSPSDENEHNLLQKLKNVLYFSTPPLIPAAQKKIITQLYPKKSKYEL
jgi:hypothetical protein